MAISNKSTADSFSEAMQSGFKGRASFSFVSVCSAKTIVVANANRIERMRRRITAEEEEVERDLILVK